MSRLFSRLREIEARKQATAAPIANVREQLGHAGDGLELAARCALGAYAARPKRGDESDAFRVGYLTACKELAVVLRHMRAGTVPTPADLATARNEAVDELAMQGNAEAAEGAMEP